MYKTIILFLMLILVASGCEVITGVKSTPEKYKDHIRTIVITDRTIGDGDVAVDNKQVTVHYTGWLYDSFNRTAKKGKKFDSSYDRGQAFSFKLGMAEVIKGWDMGIKGMKVGGQRSLVIPANLAYGSRGYGKSIPPGSVLYFDVELIEVK